MTETAAVQPWKFGDPTPNLNTALSALQGEMPDIPKTKTGKIEGQNKKGEWYSYEYKYADLADISKAANPLMAKHGLSFWARATINPAKPEEMILTYKLKHSSGEEDEPGTYPLGPVGQKPQSLGSMLTYARRYCKCTSLDIVAEDDDDGARAQALTRSSTGNADRNGNDRQAALNALDSVPPAAPQNARPPAAPVPPRLEPGDPWAAKIDAIHTVEDADAAEAELKEQYEASEQTDADKARTSQVLHWIRVKAAPMRTAAKSGRAAPPPAAAPAGADQWCIAFVTRLNETPLDGLTERRREVGRAVMAKTISAEDGNAMTGEVATRKRELEEQANAGGAATA